jgi:hypothetical protein
MLRKHRRTIPLAIGLALAMVIAGWEFIGLRSLNYQQPISTLASETVPWGGLAGKMAARAMESGWRSVGGAGFEPVLAQLGHYPLTPWHWLVMARIAWFSDGDVEELRRMLAAAIAVQPGNREIRWQAANLAQSTGDADLVLDQLARWVADEPRDTPRALFIGARWVEEPGALLDRVLPDDEAFLTEAMQYAARSGDVALAQAVWERLAQPREPTDVAFADYVRQALNAQRPDLAMAAWQRVDATYSPGDIPAGSFGVPLEALPTFGWETRMRDGVELERVLIEAESSGAKGPGSGDGSRRSEGGRQRTEDGGQRTEGGGPKTEDRGQRTESGAAANGDVGAASRPRSLGSDGDRGLETAPTNGADGVSNDVGAGSKPRSQGSGGDRGLETAPTSVVGGDLGFYSHALRVTFGGEENAYIVTPSVRFPMPEAGDYRVTGWWKAEELTTRSLPFLQVYAESQDHRFNETLEVPSPDFGWQRFEIPLTVQSANEIFRLRVRRNRTNAFDRYISGSLWVAGLDVAPAEADGQGVGD